MKENKMGSMPIKKLILTMSLPMMVSMVVQSLYNIVDSILVAQVSENALTAVSLAFPIQNLMLAIQLGTGVGINALLSRKLGENKYEDANKAALNGMFLAVVHYVLFLVAGFFLVEPFFRAQTSNPEILAAGITYSRIVMVFSFGQFIQVTSEKLLQATGRTVDAMWVQGVGAGLNIILDPIMIFGLLGFPALGVAGAAWATVIGQTVAGIVGVWMNIKRNEELSLHIRGFKPDKEIIRAIYVVGIPSTVMTSITSVTTFALNIILIQFSSTATAVFGVYYKLQSFVFMPIFGINNGIIPIISYNYGARNKKRVTDTIKLSIIYATVIMLAGLVLFQLFPTQLLGMFNASEDMMAIGVPAIRIISLCFVLAGFNIMATTIYQAFGKGMLSLWASFFRQLIVLIPLAYFLALTGNVNAVWWSYPLAELLSAFMCAYFLYSLYKRVIAHLPEDGLTDLETSQPLV